MSRADANDAAIYGILLPLIAPKPSFPLFPTVKKLSLPHSIRFSL